ncbi:NosD domain-containing protein [Halorussus salinus]|uniref:NosD domain-containing protein n=1 Tax=Halorussus salinus TaxID=1364935 RepID=UPI001092A0F6|nr:right-handed parallel beta-helix repeat-containing protein [Halorussus salinus]
MTVLLVVSMVSASTPASALPRAQGVEVPSGLDTPESFDTSGALDLSLRFDGADAFAQPAADASGPGRQFSLASATTLTVDDDGTGDYRTIQHAVDNASAGDTIRVEPGVYAQTVRLDKPLDLRAPDGATLDGSSLGSSADGIRLYGDAKVELSGLTVTGYDVGIHADHVDRNFSVVDIDLRGNRRGLYVDDTYSTWNVEASEFTNNSYSAIQTSGSSLGDATDNYWGQADGPTSEQCRGDVDCGYFRSSPTDSVSVPLDRSGTYVVAADGSAPYATMQDAIQAAPNRATVEVRPGTYRESVRLDEPLDLRAPDGAVLNGSETSQNDGIRLYNDANVTISGFTVEEWSHGIDADHVDSNFTVENVLLRRNDRGLYVDDTYSTWRVQGSEFTNNSYSAIQTSGSSLGDATDNYWGQADGPASEQCRGDVDCGYFRSAPGDSVAVPADRSGTYVVAADGSEPYATMQDAIRAAPNRATVEVRPGTYRESVRLDKPLEFRAPDGATLNGSKSSQNDGIRLYNDANATISGFTIEEWNHGIDADHVDSNFTVEEVVFRRNDRGVYVDDTYSAWNVEASEFVNNSYSAIQTSGSSLGDATDNYWGQADGPTSEQCRGDVDCGYFRSSPDSSVAVPADRSGTYVVANDGTEPYATIQDAIRAAPNRATVEVRPGTYRESVRLDEPLDLRAPDGAVLNGSESSQNDGIRLYGDANATISGFTVEEWNHGIDANHVDDPFVVQNVVLRRNGHGLYAEDNYEPWAIHHSEIYNNSYAGVRGHSSQLGDATRNYWGQADGPTSEQCRGDVDCGYFLSSPNGSVAVPADRTGTYVVANDGSEPYATMQDAIQAAPNGATVTVRPGTYRESVRIRQPLDVRAPNGATLRGSNSGSDGIRLYGHANVTISGFTIEEWNHGIDANHVDDPFVVQNVVLRRNGHGFYAEDNYEPWAIHDSKIYNNSYTGVRGHSSQLGDATDNYWGQADGPTKDQCRGDVDCGYFRHAPDDPVSVPANRSGTYVVANDGSEPYATMQDAIQAAPNRATVEVRPGTYRESVRIRKPLSFVAPDGAVLNGSNSGADGIRLYGHANATISGFTVEEWNHGIDANHVDDPFVVENVVLRRNGHGFYAEDNYEPWAIHHSEIYNNSYTGVRGHSSQVGDATDNYWGRADGPTSEQCRGDVDCGYFRSSPDESVAVPTNRTGTYVVANDGSEPYATMQDAIQAAPNHATVEVRPGTYRESVRIRQPLSFVAPDGAVLNGSNSNSDGIRLYGHANATVSGFTVEEWNHGIDANHVDDPFVVENVVLRRNGHGLYAEDNYEPWGIHRSEIYNNSYAGVRGHSSQVGNATGNYWGQADGPTKGQCRGDVDCGYFLPSPDGSVDIPLVRPRVHVVAEDGSAPYATIQDAVEVAESGDTVEVRPGTYRESVRIRTDINLTAPRGAVLNGSTLGGGSDGISLSNRGGASVSGFVVREFDAGVRASGVDRAVSITNSHLVNNSYGVRVRYANAPWEIHDSLLANNSATGVYAYRSDGGDATRNYWGQLGGPLDGQCDPAVDCSNPLSKPPAVRGDRISYTSPSELEFNVGIRNPVVNRSLRFQTAGVTTSGAEIAKVEWNFGDGTTARGRQVAHTYDSPGVYTVTHSAVTEEGRGFSVTQQITVGEEPASFGVVSVTPHLSGHPRKNVVVIEGLPLDLSYRAAVSQPSNTEEVRFRLGNATHVDADGSDGYTFPVDPSVVDGDETLVATAVHTNGSTASRGIRVGHISTPEWFQTMTVSVSRPTHGYLILSSERPLNVSNRIPAEFPFKDKIDMPGTGENQSTSAGVTVTVKVDLTTTETEVSVGGQAGYKMKVVEINGSAAGKAFFDLEEGDLTKGELELKVTGSAEFPPNGIPNPPIGPVPPNVVNLYPIFEGEVKLVTTFDEKDTVGPGDEVAFEFEKGEVAPKLGAKQEIGKKWSEIQLVVGFEEEIASKVPLPEASPITVGLAGQVYARAQAYMFTKTAYFPSGKKNKFSTEFTLYQDGSEDSTTAGVGSSETTWQVRETSGDRPPKPEYETADGTRQTAGPWTGFADARFETDGAMPARIVDTGVVTDNTVADETPAITRVGSGHTVVWSHQSGGKSALNGRDVQVARIDGDRITTLAPVTDDAMGDFDPAVAGSAADGTLAAFTTFDRTFEDADGPAAVYPHGEIRVATANDSGWSAPTFLTDDDDFDFGPAVAQHGDEWLVAWTEDGDGNLTTWRDQSVQYVRYDGTDGSVGPVHTVETASAPSVAATADGFRVGYLAMNDSSTSGTLTVETVGAEAGLPKQSERTIPVAKLGDADVSATHVGVIDTGSTNASITVADATGARTVETGPNVSTPQTVELTEQDGDLLVNFRAYPDASDVAAAFYKPRIDGEWLPARKYADGSARNLTFWQGSAAPTENGFVSVFAGQDLTSDQQADVYAFEHRFRPDLTLNASLDAENVGVGDEVTVAYEVRNTGDTAAEESNLTVQSGAETLRSVELPPVPVGETVTGTATVTVDETGLLSVSADADDALAEFDEENNDVRALALRPDLNVTAVTATRDGDTVTVAANVTNPSAVRAGTVEYRLGNGPTLQHYGTIPGLDPGETRTVTVSVPASDVDPSYTTRFELAPNETAIDGNDSDDLRSRYLFQPDLTVSDGRVGYYERAGTVRASVLVSNAGLADTPATVEVRNSSTGALVASRNVTAEASDSTSVATFTEVTLDLAGVSAGDAVEILVTAPGETALADNVVVDRVKLDTTLVPPSGEIRMSESAVDVDESVQLTATNLSDADGEAVHTQWNVSDTAFDVDETAVNWTGRTPGHHTVRLVVVDDDGVSTVVTDTLLVRPPRPALLVGSAAPRDVDGDGRYRDVDGDGSVESGDVRAFFDAYRDELVRTNDFAFDFNEDGDDIDVLDVQALHASANETNANETNANETTTDGTA